MPGKVTYVSFPFICVLTFLYLLPCLTFTSFDPGFTTVLSVSGRSYIDLSRECVNVTVIFLFVSEDFTSAFSLSRIYLVTSRYVAIQRSVSFDLM